MHRYSINSVVVIWLMLIFVFPAWALDSNEEREVKILVDQLASLNQTNVSRALSQLISVPQKQTLASLIALRDGTLRATIDKSAVIVESDGRVVDAISGEFLKSTESIGLKPVPINNQIRRLLKIAVPFAELLSSNAEQRLFAADSLQGVLQKEGVNNLRQLLIFESDLRVRRSLLIALAPFDLKDTNSPRQVEILEAILAQDDTSNEHILREVLIRIPQEGHAQEESQIKSLAEDALSRIERRKFIAEQTGNLLYGISLGSVLLLTSLGLAVTLGLMGVINMAHGELLMLGAYSTYVVQNLFHRYLPDLFDWYLLASIPVVFALTALVGIALERTIIRHLYGRPLETLLATWGISLMLIQAVRLTFGASNVEVANPVWLSGSVEIAGALLPLNRIFCIVFTIIVCILTWWLFQKTRFGLEVRAISQNRLMAAAGGVSTSRIDMLTFALGSGIAGLGGLVLTQLGNVGPELGQGYIVDSFLVVVFGGVGKIIGTVYAALSLGIVNKALEPLIGAVLGKIFVLFLLVIFIQRRPQGLYSIQLREMDV